MHEAAAGTVGDQPRHNGLTAPDLASDAEKSLLGIVHLTESADRRLAPEELYGVLSGLTRLAAVVPEVVTRVVAQLTEWHGSGSLGAVAGRFHGDPAAALDAVTTSLADDILPALGRLQFGLDRAQAAAAHVHVMDGSPANRQ